MEVNGELHIIKLKNTLLSRGRDVVKIHTYGLERRHLGEKDIEVNRGYDLEK